MTITTTAVIAEYAELYGARPTPTTLAHYADALDDYSTDDVRAAMRRLSRTCKWLPRPAEIAADIQESRIDAVREQRTDEIMSAGRGKPLRGRFRVPADRSIMEHIEHLQRDGMSTDEIADALCGPEQPESESRYRCRYCRDTRFVTVFRRSVLDAVYHGREHRHDTGAVPCCCAAADEIAQSKRWNGTRFSASSHVITTGDHLEDTRSLERYRSTRLASKRHSAFDGYDTPVEELF